MPTSMTFTSLQGDVQAYLERGGSYDAAAIQQLPRLINNADRKSTRLNSSHGYSSYAVSCLKKTIAQVDYGSAERGIAAALSEDTVLNADYLSGDPYRQFAAAALGVLNPTEQQRAVYNATDL